MRITTHIKVLLMLFVTSVAILSCKDDSPFYNAKNTITQFDGTAIDYLKAQPNTYDSLLKVVERLPDVKDALVNKQVTLFAVTNKSFISALKNLNAVRVEEGKTLINLDNADAVELEILVCKYILTGQKLTDDFKSFLDGIYVRSFKIEEQMHVQYGKDDASGYVGGGPQTVTYSDTKSGFVRVYWERTPTTIVNIQTKNAVIYSIDPLHNFGFNEFTLRLNK